MRRNFRKCVLTPGRGGRLGRPLVWGAVWLLAGLCLRRPCLERRGGLRADNAHGEGDGGGHQEEHNQTGPPQRAPPCLSAPCRPMGARLGRVGALVGGGVDAAAARGEARVPSEDAHTCPEEVVPGSLAGATPPRQSRPRRRPEAGTLAPGPAQGVGHQPGGAPTCQPGPRRGRQRVGGLPRAHGGGHGFQQGAPNGGWLGTPHPRLQAIGAAQAERDAGIRCA